jgi:putative DNA primase/helicase
MDDRLKSALEKWQAQQEQLPPETLQCVIAADIPMSAVDWVWEGRFAVGKLGLLVGLPDEGKGQVFAYIVARITRGEQWPCGEGIPPKGSVILLTAEDDPGDTVVPRLAAAGADLTRVHIVQMVRTGDDKRMFSLITDLELLRKKIAEIGNVVVVLIDPLSAYLGMKLNSFRTTDVRAALNPVVELAQETRVSILGIMHFNKKVDVTNALLRISDSLAFGAVARHTYAIVADADNERKLMVKGKNNLAPGTQKALAYTFATKDVGHDPNTGKRIVAPYIVWQSDYVDVTASEAMQAANENKSPGARNEAKAFLRDYLASGPMPKTEIDEAAEASGFTAATLRRAQRELNIIARKEGFGKEGKWIWELPAKKSWTF